MEVSAVLTNVGYLSVYPYILFGYLYGYTINDHYQYLYRTYTLLFKTLGFLAWSVFLYIYI